MDFSYKDNFQETPSFFTERKHRLNPFELDVLSRKDSEGHERKENSYSFQFAGSHIIDSSIKDISQNSITNKQFGKKLSFLQAQRILNSNPDLHEIQESKEKKLNSLAPSDKAVSVSEISLGKKEFIHYTVEEGKIFNCSSRSDSTRQRIIFEKWLPQTVSDNEQSDRHSKWKQSYRNATSQLKDDSLNDGNRNRMDILEAENVKTCEINCNIRQTDDVESASRSDITIIRNKSIESNITDKSRQHEMNIHRNRNENRMGRQVTRQGLAERTTTANADLSTVTIRNPALNSLQTRAQFIEEVLPQTLSSRVITAKQDIKLFLLRCLAVFLSFGTISLFLLLMLNQNIPYNALFYLFDGCLAYYGIENLVRLYYLKRAAWKRIDDLFSIFDCIGGIFFSLFVQMKLSGYISFSMIAFIPFAMTNFVYLFSSRTPKILKFQNTIVRFYYTAQVFLITAKIDKFLDWDWKIIFGFSWIFLALLGLYFVSYLIIFVLTISFALFRQRLFEEIEILLQIIGTSWHLLYYGLNVIISLILLGISQAYTDNGDFELLEIAAKSGFLLNALLSIYTVIAFKRIAKFIQVFDIGANRGASILGSQKKKRQPTINFEVEKKDTYFVMLSSTYFLPLSNGLFVKNEEKLKRLKEALSNLRFGKPKEDIRMEKSKANEKVNIQVLKGYKEALNNQFCRTANAENIKKESKKHLEIKKTKIFSDLDFASYRDNLDREGSKDLKSLKSNHRLHLSADDVNIPELIKTNKDNKPVNDENLCYLCYSKLPNAVLMNCGHGGICYDCANLLVQKKNECMECRSSIHMIYKIDPNPKLSDIIRGVELCKVTKK